MSTISYYNNIQISHESRRIMLGEVDSAMKNAWSLIYKDDYYDIVAHGSPDGMYPKVNGQDYPISARFVYAILCKQSDYNDQPIRLVSCSVGRYADGFAQQLANLAGVPVLAATNKIFVDDNRELRFYDPLEFGNPIMPSDLEPKEWIIYYPQ